jgi:hypothetical protein
VRHASRAVRDEHGNVTLIVAVALVLLLGIVSLVVDLAIVRQARAEGKSSTDFAATAGAATLAEEGNPRAGCIDAFLYFAENAHDVSINVGEATSACTSFPLGVSGCASDSPANVATIVDGDHTIRVTWPVPDADPMLVPDAIGDPGQSLSSFDGRPCERLAVSTRVERDLVFAGIFGTETGRTSVHSVARAFLPDPISDQPAALVILEPTGCDALVASGSGSDGTHPQVHVKAVPVADGGLTVWQPGLIAVDSDASACTDGQYVIRRDGEHSWIEAEATPDPPMDDGPDPSQPGRLQSIAMGTYPDRVWQGPTAVGKIVPAPTLRTTPVTRLPMDVRYNCGTSWGCPGASSFDGPVDALRAAYGQGTGLDPSGPYGGDFEDPRLLGLPFLPPGTCSYAGGPTTYTVVPAGNWIIDCPLFEVKRPIVFEGGNVIFTGGVSLSGGGALFVNYLDPNDALPTDDLLLGSGDGFLYVREGGLAGAGGTTFKLHQTLLFIEDGSLNITGGADNISWSAPCDGPPSCSGQGGVREDFEDLVLWAEDADASPWRIAGGGTMHISGIVFTPEADPFEIQGVGLDSASKAQFWVERLDVAGNGDLAMVPDPTRTQPIPPEEAVALIR